MIAAVQRRCRLRTQVRQKRGGATTDDNFKMGLMMVALFGSVIYASATAMGMDMGVADAVMQLVQRGTDLLHRLFYH